MDEHAYRRLREYNDSLKAIDDPTAPPPAGSGCRNAPSGSSTRCASSARAADAERDLRAAIPAQADGAFRAQAAGSRRPAQARTRRQPQKQVRLPDRKGGAPCRADGGLHRRGGRGRSPARAVRRRARGAVFPAAKYNRCCCAPASMRRTGAARRRARSDTRKERTLWGIRLSDHFTQKAAGSCCRPLR